MLSSSLLSRSAWSTRRQICMDPAVQISHRVNLIDEAELIRVSDLLKRESINYRSIDLETGFLLIRFDSEEEQLRAATQIRDILDNADKRYGVALNLAPAFS